MSTNYRQERVERLLQELQYEIERGMMQGEINEYLGFQFYVPISKTFPNGIVACEFRTRPMPAWHMPPQDPCGPRLKIVK